MRAKEPEPGFWKSLIVSIIAIIVFLLLLDGWSICGGTFGCCPCHYMYVLVPPQDLARSCTLNDRNVIEREMPKDSLKSTDTLCAEN